MELEGSSLLFCKDVYSDLLEKSAGLCWEKEQADTTEDLYCDIRLLSLKNLGMANAASKPFQVLENILKLISHLKSVPFQRYWLFVFPGGGRALSFLVKDKRATSCLLWSVLVICGIIFV